MGLLRCPDIMTVAGLLVVNVFRICEAELPRPGSQRGRWEPEQPEQSRTGFAIPSETLFAFHSIIN